MFFTPNASAEQFEALWRPFFHDFNVDEDIDISFQNHTGQTGNLTVRFDRSVTVPVPPIVLGNQPVFSASINPLAFIRRSFSGDESRLVAFQNGMNGLVLEPGNELSPSELLASSIPVNASQVANWFSQLSVEDREHDIIQIIQDAFPNIQAVSVQSPQGIAQLYATLRYQNRKLPITSVSSGITKFISILIAMKVYTGGVLLIDEVENGIHYEMFPLLWKTLARFSKSTNTQIFATTHSLECLSAAAETFTSERLTYSLIQVTQEGGNTILASSMADKASDAILGNIEVRR